MLESSTTARRRAAAVTPWKTRSASAPNKPNVESTNGIKLTLLSLQHWPYLECLTRSMASTALLPFLTAQHGVDGANGCTMETSIAHGPPPCQ